MSDSTPQPPVEEKKIRLEPPPNDDIDIDAIPTMSAEEVDALLQREAPEFVKAVAAIAADKSLSLEQIIIDDASAALNAEQDWWQERTGPLKLLYKLIPVMPKISLRLKHWKFHLSASLHAGWIHTKHFVHDVAKGGWKKIFSFSKKTAHQILASLKETSATIKKLTLKAKLIFLSSLALVALSAWVIYRSMTHGLIPADKEMFLQNFAEHATQAYDYDPKETETYLDNPRAMQNIFLTRKIIANLKPTPGSGPNPMAAFEFFIEGMSSDVLVEIKDREPYMRDLMQRTVEEMTFDELDTDEGKRDLCARLQKAISKVLTTGKVKNVRIKTVIIKP